MAAEQGARGRSRRRACTSLYRRDHYDNVPSAALYVGYCEDFETPEMIERKFEELERVMAEKQVAQIPEAAGDSSTAQPAEDSALDESLLLEVFKRTSTFSVRSAQAGNEALLAGLQQVDDGGAGEVDEDELGFLRRCFSDDEVSDHEARKRRHHQG